MKLNPKIPTCHQLEPNMGPSSILNVKQTTQSRLVLNNYYMLYQHQSLDIHRDYHYFLLE
jgi:hypothetical protein